MLVHECVRARSHTWMRRAELNSVNLAGFGRKGRDNDGSLVKSQAVKKQRYLTARESLARAASRTASMTSSSVLFRDRFLRVESESVAADENALRYQSSDGHERYRFCDK